MSVASSAYVVRDASPALQPHVGRLWDYVEHTGAPTRQREPMSPNVVLIFGLGTELGVDGERLGTFVGGVSHACPVIEHDGSMRGVQVDLTPLAARMVLRVPMHEIARRSLPLADVLGPAADRLDERLAAAATPADRFAVIEEALARLLDDAPPPPPDVEWAWTRLVASHGRTRVERLATALGCSRKHLAARFREHVGLPPKLVARTMRFRRAAELLVAGAALDDIAHVCGYYDQSHLDRDFREFASTTPTLYRQDPRAQVTFFQDG